MSTVRSIQRRQCWSSYRACLRRYREEAQVTEQQYRDELMRSTSGPTWQEPIDSYTMVKAQSM